MFTYFQYRNDNGLQLEVSVSQPSRLQQYFRFLFREMLWCVSCWCFSRKSWFCWVYCCVHLFFISTVTVIISHMDKVEQTARKIHVYMVYLYKMCRQLCTTLTVEYQNAMKTLIFFSTVTVSTVTVDPLPYCYGTDLSFKKLCCSFLW